MYAERVCSRVGRVEAATDPEPRRKRRQKDVKTGFSPLTHRDRAHEPLRRRRQPRTRRPRGVKRHSRRNDLPGARRAVLGRMASPHRAHPRFAAKTSGDQKPPPHIDLHPWYELVAEQSFRLVAKRRHQPRSPILRDLRRPCARRSECRPRPKIGLRAVLGTSSAAPVAAGPVGARAAPRVLIATGRLPTAGFRQ